MCSAVGCGVGAIGQIEGSVHRISEGAGACDGDGLALATVGMDAPQFIGKPHFGQLRQACILEYLGEADRRGCR